MSTKPRVLEVGRGGIVSGPLVTANAIYASVREDATVRLDRQTLQKVWSVDSEGFRLGPLLDDAFLIVSGRPPGDAGVRNAEDGALLWSDYPRLPGLGVWRSQVVFDSEAGIELRDPATGVVRQTHSAAGSYSSWACKHGDTAVLQDHRVLKAIDLSSGRIKWERPLVEEMQQLLAEHSESAGVAMTAGSLPGVLILFHAGSTFAISADDGSILWQAAVWSPYSWPVVHEGRVYAACLDRFRAVDEETGETIYDTKHPELKDAFRDKTGTVHKNRLAVANESGHLAVLDLADGALVSIHEAKMALWRTAEADGRLLVATGEGTVLAFDESIWGS